MASGSSSGGGGGGHGGGGGGHGGGAHGPGPHGFGPHRDPNAVGHGWSGWWGGWPLDSVIVSDVVVVDDDSDYTDTDEVS